MMNIQVKARLQGMRRRLDNVVIGMKTRQVELRSAAWRGIPFAQNSLPSLH